MTGDRWAIDLGQCEICSQHERGRSWHLRYRRKGTTSGDLQESFESGERPASCKELGTKDVFVGSRCQRRLFWRNVLGLADNRVVTWLGLGLAVVLVALYPLQRVSLAVGLFLSTLSVLLRHDPVSIRRRIFAWLRPELAARHDLAVRRLELAEPMALERLAAFLGRSRDATR